MRKRLSAPELRLDLMRGPGDNGTSPIHSVPSSPGGSSDLEVDELETPSDSEQLDSGHEFEWEGGRDTLGQLGERPVKEARDGYTGAEVRTTKVATKE